MPEQGDWYARGMYIESNRQYNDHVRTFGNPPEYGYKDIYNDWVIDFDEHTGDSQIDLGARMGRGLPTPPLIANDYNKSLRRSLA